MRAGKKYRIRYKTPLQKFEREAVMLYLEFSGTEHIFSARPVAGTQPVPESWLISHEEVPDDTVPYLNRVIRG
jgi:hypothetical protein